jgi:hypothetical protein
MQRPAGPISRSSALSPSHRMLRRSRRPGIEPRARRHLFLPELGHPSAADVVRGRLLCCLSSSRPSRPAPVPAPPQPCRVAASMPGRAVASLPRLQRARTELLAVGTRRGHPRSNLRQESVKSELPKLPRPSAGQVRCSPAGNSGRRCGQSAQGLHCSDFVLSRGWNAKPRDLFVRNQFSDLGCPG